MKKKSLILISSVICTLLALCIFVSWWLALTIGLIILGILGYIEQILNIKWSRKLSIFLLILFGLLSAGNVIYSHYKERNLHEKIKRAEGDATIAKSYVADLTENEHNLREKLKQAEDTASTAKGHIADLTEYEEVATYDFNGYQKSGLFLSPFTSVAKWNEGHLSVCNGVYRFDCSQDSMNHYENIIKKCPKFPFAYLALSQCLLNRKDPSWKEYAAKAKLIFQKTKKYLFIHKPTTDG